MSDPFDDQAQAATAQARRNLHNALGLPDEPSPRGSSPLFDELFDRYATAPRCEHLMARPVQPWTMALPWGEWYCNTCAPKFAAANRGKWLGDLEEFTCDRCRRYVSGELQVTIVRQDMWVIVLSMCRRCAAWATECGAREITPGAAA